MGKIRDKAFHAAALALAAVLLAGVAVLPVRVSAVELSNGKFIAAVGAAESGSKAISTLAALKQIGTNAANPSDGNYHLTANLTISGGWTPLCAGGFTGTFDGQGYVLTGLTGALFDNADGATIKNVGLEGSAVSYSGTVTSLLDVSRGMLCNSADNTTIENCYNAVNLTVNYTGNFSQSDSAITLRVGGLCGVNNGGKITDSYNKGNITASATGTLKTPANAPTNFDVATESYAGGISGDCKAAVEYCFNAGAISASATPTVEIDGTGARTSAILKPVARAYAGGICGQSGNVVNVCHNTGSVKTSMGGGADSKAEKVIFSADYISYAGGISGRGAAGLGRDYNTGAVSAELNGGAYSGNDAWLGDASGSYVAIYSGGICGRLDNATVSSSYSTGGSAFVIQGGFGLNATKLGKLQSATLEYYGGGICGYGNAANCYNRGAIGERSHLATGSGSWGKTSTISIGGVCGKGTATNSYSAADLNSSAEGNLAATVATNMGAVCGEGSATNGYWLDDGGQKVDGMARNNPAKLQIGTALGNTGSLSDTNMKNQASFTGFDFTVVWKIDGGENSGYPILDIVGADKPSITTASPLAGGVVGTAYSEALAANGRAAFTWSVASGSLPAGLTLNRATGEISGTPTAATASASFTVKAANGAGSDTKDFTITITEKPNITTTSIPGGVKDTPYTAFTLAATGTAPITWDLKGADQLPAWLALNTATGEITGTPTAAGTVNFTVTATNSAGTAEKALSMTIALEPLTGAPSITLNRGSGVLTAVTTGLSGSGALTYAWSGTGVTNPDPTSATLPAANYKLGGKVTLTVTRADAGGSQTADITVYMATVTPVGNSGSDDVSIARPYGEVGSNVAIDYTLDHTGVVSDSITYTGAVAPPAEVTAAGTGTSRYTMAAGDANANGIIALTATFAHTNLPELTGTAKITLDRATGGLTADTTGLTGGSGAFTYVWGGTGVTDSGAATLGQGDYDLAEEVTLDVTRAGTTGSATAAITVYKTTVTPVGDAGADSVSIASPYGRIGDAVTIAYTIACTEVSNELTYSGVGVKPAAIYSMGPGADGTGSSSYTIAAADAASGVITITATFSHRNVPLLTGTPSISLNPATGELTAVTDSLSGGSDPFDYVWSGAGVTDSDAEKLTAYGLGKPVTLTVTRGDAGGIKTASITVYKTTVTAPGKSGIDNVSIASPYGKAGDTVALAYTLDSTGVTSNTLTYSGAATPPAKITAAGTGSSSYTVVAGDANASGTIALTATFAHSSAPPPKYNLTVSAGAGGTVTPSAVSQHEEGDVVNITATPNTGYVFKEWQATKGAVANATSASTTFTMPDEAATVTAVFEAVSATKYTLTVTAGAGGTVAPSGASQRSAGETVTIVATPNSGYAFKEWQAAKGTIADAMSASTTFTMPVEAATVTAVFEAVSSPSTKYDLTVTAGAGGTVTPSGASQRSAGETVTIAATPNSGYAFKEWQVTKGTVTSATSASTTFTMPSEAATVTAVFEAVASSQHNLTVTAGTGGSVSPSGASQRTAGDLVPITATPIAGYYFKEWQTTGGTLASATSPSTTFTMPSADASVTAVFSLIVAAPSYDLTVTAGNGGHITQGTSGKREAGSVIYLSATPNDGYAFIGWTAANGYLENPYSLGTAFVMPSSPVVVSANFTPISASGSSASSASAKHFLNLTYEVGGRIEALTDYYAPGAAVTLTATANDGYVFAGWTATSGGFSDSTAATTKFTMPTGDTTVTARFTPASEYSAGSVNAPGSSGSAPLIGLPDSSMPSDISSWAVDGVRSGMSHGLATDELLRGARAVTTRAEFCRAIVNFLEKYYGASIQTILQVRGVQAVTFADAKDAMNSAGAAAALGIVSGTDRARNLFDPNGQLTREQAATMLFNLAKVTGKNVDIRTEDWADKNSISSWAAESVNAMRTNGIMGSTSASANVFSPKSPYTHEQSIMTLNSMWEYLK